MTSNQNQPGSVDQKPLYGCANCHDEYSFPAVDLRVHAGRCWCEDCWDAYRDEGEPLWGDLPGFVPELNGEWKECAFVGPPPTGCKSWSDWAKSGLWFGAVVSAREGYKSVDRATDFDKDQPMSDDMREAFERELLENWGEPFHDLHPAFDDQYANHTVNALWFIAQWAAEWHSQQAQGEAVGIVEPSDHQTVSALTDPYHPLRMAVAETSPGSIQSLPDGTKLYTAPPASAAVPEDERVAALEAFIDRFISSAESVTRVRAATSYSDSYFGERPGAFKESLLELDHTISAYRAYQRGDYNPLHRAPAPAEPTKIQPKRTNNAN